MSILQKFHYSIRRLSVYEENDPLVPILLNEMATAPLAAVGNSSPHLHVI